jgi:ribosomal protein L28
MKTQTSKAEILQNLCYTKLVYCRINKKLNVKLSTEQIEELLSEVIAKTDEHFFEKAGKNYYVTNTGYNIRITINSNTFRVITVDRIYKK